MRVEPLVAGTKHAIGYGGKNNYFMYDQGDNIASDNNLLEL
jgi:hypothetical protein